MGKREEGKISEIVLKDRQTRHATHIGSLRVNHEGLKEVHTSVKVKRCLEKTNTPVSPA